MMSVTGDVSHRSQGPKFCTLQLLLVYQKFVIFSLMLVPAQHILCLKGRQGRGGGVTFTLFQCAAQCCFSVHAVPCLHRKCVTLFLFCIENESGVGKPKQG